MATGLMCTLCVVGRMLGVADVDAPEASRTEPAIEAPDESSADEPKAPTAEDHNPSESAEIDERERARALFRQGNGYFEQGQYREALAVYRETVALWDHPAVHFNITVCLIHLDEPIQAYDHIQRVLAVDPAEVGADFYERASTYDKLLSAQLATLEIRCEQDDVAVTFDGKQVLACPGTHIQYALPGEHQLVASGAGLVTSARSLDLRAGTSSEETIRLEPPSAPRPPETVLVRRWKPWVPWVPTALGVAAVGAGIGLRVAAERNADQYDQEIARQCPQGCQPDDVQGSLQDLWSRARAQNAVAIGALSVGGAAVVSGVVLLILNRPRRVQRSAPDVDVMVGNGITVVGRF